MYIYRPARLVEHHTHAHTTAQHTIPHHHPRTTRQPLCINVRLTRSNMKLTILVIDLYSFRQHYKSPTRGASARIRTRYLWPTHAKTEAYWQGLQRTRTNTNAIPLTHTRKDRNVLAGIAAHTYEYARESLYDQRR